MKQIEKDFDYYLGEALRYFVFGMIISAILIVVVGTCIKAGS